MLDGLFSLNPQTDPLRQLLFLTTTSDSSNVSLLMRKLRLIVFKKTDQGLTDSDKPGTEYLLLISSSQFYIPMEIQSLTVIINF